jgi:5'(3')-deoxyribonucleotidase
VTAPLRGSPYWRVERTKWLLQLVEAENLDIVFTHDKSRVWGDVFIDDRLENVEAWAEVHQQGLAIVWDHPYNRARTPPGIHRATSWSQVFQIIRDYEAQASIDQRPYKE